MAAEAGYEVIRYVLYILDFVFGVMMWGVTANKLKNAADELEALLGKDLNCAVFNVRFQDGTPTKIGSSALCDAIIGIGVVLMLVLFVVIVWHSLSFFDRSPIPYTLEMIILGVMSLIWFILGITVLAMTSGEIRTFREVKTCIAGGWMAGFTHLGGAIVAGLQARA